MRAQHTWAFPSAAGVRAGRNGSLNADVSQAQMREVQGRSGALTLPATKLSPLIEDSDSRGRA
eukprot:12757750-Alexandrium_andersonii.AAC.1